MDNRLTEIAKEIKSIIKDTASTTDEHRSPIMVDETYKKDKSLDNLNAIIAYSKIDSKIQQIPEHKGSQEVIPRLDETLIKGNGYEFIGLRDEKNGTGENKYTKIKIKTLITSIREDKYTTIILGTKNNLPPFQHREEYIDAKDDIKKYKNLYTISKLIPDWRQKLGKDYDHGKDSKIILDIGFDYLRFKTLYHAYIALHFIQNHPKFALLFSLTYRKKKFYNKNNDLSENMKRAKKVFENCKKHTKKNGFVENNDYLANEENHLEVFVSAGEWTLRDLDSRNGTLVGDERVRGRPDI